MPNKESLQPPREPARRRRGLLASGVLVGESVIGIAIALSDVLHAKSNLLSIQTAVDHRLWGATALVIFAILILGLFRSVTVQDRSDSGTTSSSTRI